MRLPIQPVLIAFAAAFYVACSPVVFEKDVDCGPGCVRVDGMKEVEYNVTVSGGRVDILFVNDNSGSMSFEQNHIASRFSNFIATLDQKQLDYRIGIITTDVSDSSNPPRAINGNGALQDGRLITFENGQPFLESSTQNKEALFAKGIQRNETKQCENFLRTNSASQGSSAYLANCPSADERGIYAAGMTVESNPSGFIRDNAHLAIVFLADEDERSQLYDDTPLYRLSDRDLPQSLVGLVQSRFPGKALSMHSIIVRPGDLKAGYSAYDAAQKIAQVFNGNQLVSENRAANFFNDSQKDQQCLNQQSNQIQTANGNVTGSFGYLYYLAAKMTGGVIGDICAGDYGSQLSSIGENIGEQVNKIDLACENPQVLELRFTNQSGTPGGRIEGSAYLFDPALTPGHSIYLKIRCPDNY